MLPKVAVIVLNWNGWRETIECLESLYHVSYPDHSVIVVDNDSSNDSVERIKKWCEGRRELIELTRQDAEGSRSQGTMHDDLPSNKNLILIRNDKNYGFAEGNNIGIRWTIRTIKPDLILLLNNDTVVDPGFLTELVSAAETSGMGVGILGPKIYYHDYNGRNDILWYAGGRIDPLRDVVYEHTGENEVDSGQFDIGADVDWVSGCALMFRPAITERIGLLNSEYQFGNEDVEFCIKAKNLGFRILYVPKSRVWHKCGMSRDSSGYRLRDLPGYLRFVRNNFAWPVYLYHVMLIGVAVLPRWMILYVTKYRDSERFERFIWYIKNMSYPKG